MIAVFHNQHKQLVCLKILNGSLILELLLVI